ncbi:ATP-binding cassette domain-containing protein [Hoyosella rhizosphaerae]|uniref:Daunorubicin resistance protein DrrA family ABC transporter ATP-binding protein n=1 Tax=Hoyosella rhizosphaerae TaxID=1755582 RepID=A0A916UAT4_9ACTN|nr:ATP-binding cassette domain-containing protein [Hoyosella rhizosphaerae]MBN4926112.1 ATP-binding cassette domain-containing protein [Hoyosella rhizosphaerae]GGC65498.1 daunorubicin resistance protein DrrA family ABC transporter ATP-binding protein [Hoyosella rhizosphaerae]
MSSPTVAIQAEGMVKRYGPVTAVNDVNLTVPAGTVHAVLGPNGAGKTTTVRMLATLLRPTSGSAKIFGYDVVRDATAVRSLIGVTGQYASVDNDLSAYENLTIFARLVGLSRKQAKVRTDELLEEFSLTDVARRPLKNFSGGMRRRLDLAATLISKPPLIFLDEPTTGLDPRTRVDMWNTVRRLVAQGSTILLTTQYLEEADELADRITVIDRGAVVAEGTAIELKESIGRSVFTVVVDDPEQHQRAIGIVERITCAPVNNIAAGRIATNHADASSATTVLLALQQAGITVRELGLSRPDLNEVFFALTGDPQGQSDTTGEAA